MPPAGGARLTAGLPRGEKGPAAATAVSAGARLRAHGRSRGDRETASLLLTRNAAPYFQRLWLLGSYCSILLLNLEI